MPADAIEFRHAETGDLDAILDVLRAALGETPLLRRTPELFEWKHERNPFGKSIVLVAQAGARIAGVRAMMRWDLATSDGATVRCVRPVDTATHPDFTRRGIFRRLTLEALDLARANEIDLVFNTPNEKSGAGYEKMGWRQVGRIGVLARPRLRRAVPTSTDRVPTLDELMPAGQPYHPTVVESRPPSGLRTTRDENYLRWRFAEHPTARYGLIGSRYGRGGVIVRPSTRGGRAELVVSDILGDADANTVRRTARSNRARYMAGWFSPGSPERRSAIRGGMMPIPFLTPMRLMALPLSDVAQSIDLFDLQSWDIATSDLELL